MILELGVYVRYNGLSSMYCIGKGYNRDKITHMLDLNNINQENNEGKAVLDNFFLRGWLTCIWVPRNAICWRIQRC